MRHILSTYRFVGQPLGPSLLADIARANIVELEIFCSPAHFDYRLPQAIREFAGALDEYGLRLHSLHSPTERDFAPGRDSGVPISICDPERIRRVDAVDEVKRALEVAERIPFHYLIQHLGHSHQRSDPRNLDAAFSSLEHLAIFAKERGVTIALENTPGEIGSPEFLERVIKETRLKDLKFCFDTGHAHMEGGVEKSFEIMQARIVTAHIHDNHGEKDEHLLPSDGTIDWEALLSAFAAMPAPPDLVLELKEYPAAKPSLDQIREAFDKLERNFEDRRPRAAQA